MKILWLDTETTGLDPVKNDIIQMAGIITIDGEVRSEFEFKCAPYNSKNIQMEALEVNGRTIEEIMKWDNPGETFRSFISVINFYVDQYDKKDKFILAGHNPYFDKAFLEQMAIKAEFKYLFSYLDYHMLDTAQLAMAARMIGCPMPESNKLVSLCEFFDIPLKAHDAMEDIVATRKLCHKLIALIQNSKGEKN